MLDMAAVSIRRMLKGRSPVRADRTHLHHRLMDIGYSARQTLVLMLILSLVLFLFGILLTQMGGLHAGIGFFAYFAGLCGFSGPNRSGSKLKVEFMIGTIYLAVSRLLNGA